MSGTTMYMGYRYEMGKNIGYDIDVDGLGCFSCVAYKDKGRILRELKSNGYSDSDINVKRVKNDWY